MYKPIRVLAALALMGGMAACGGGNSDPQGPDAGSAKSDKVSRAKTTVNPDQALLEDCKVVLDEPGGEQEIAEAQATPDSFCACMLKRIRYGEGIQDNMKMSWTLAALHQMAERKRAEPERKLDDIAMEMLRYGHEDDYASYAAYEEAQNLADGLGYLKDDKYTTRSIMRDHDGSCAAYWNK